MTKYIPHVSIAAFVAIVIQALQYVNTNLPAFEAAVGASIIPAVLAIATTAQQMIQSKSITPSQLGSLQSDIAELKAGWTAIKAQISGTKATTT